MKNLAATLLTLSFVTFASQAMAQSSVSSFDRERGAHTVVAPTTPSIVPQAQPAAGAGNQTLSTFDRERGMGHTAPTGPQPTATGALVTPPPAVEQVVQ